MQMIHHKTLDHKASQLTVPLDPGRCLKYIDLIYIRLSRISRSLEELCIGSDYQFKEKMQGGDGISHISTGIGV